MKGSARLIVVDEIDISLDAAAQVRLVKRLRDFCAKYNCNVLFTTHSLAMIRTLDDGELFYMERCGVETTMKAAPYSYVKSRLFGFTGWDRYILTEDSVLSGFLETFIRRRVTDVFFEYKIIYVGGGGQVRDLLKRNREEHFFGEPDRVIAVLDGDQSGTGHPDEEDVYFLPFASVEEALHEYYFKDDFPYKLSNDRQFSGPKDLFRALQQNHLMSKDEIFRYVCDMNDSDLEELHVVLRKFLSKG